MRVNVFGLGYVGCVTAACLAKAGHEVIGVDIDEEKVAMVNAGASPVVEPGLGAILAEGVDAGRLRATISTPEALRNAEIGLVCVGTPGRASGQLGVDALERVGQEIGRGLAERAAPYTVVLRSTVLPGTTERVLVPALTKGVGRELGSALRLAVNPEFMREGSSLQDFAHPPFTLVGCDDAETAAVLRSLYGEVEAPFVHTTVRTAEVVKYVSNAFHALKVCFANEIGDVCAALGADAQEAMRIFLMDRKLNVSDAYLRPGFAFGGSCLPKDLRALVYAGRAADVSLPLLSAILPSNEGQVRRAVEAVLETRKRKIGVVGLSFKPGTDDLRESPMVTLVEALIGKGCDVRIFDPNVALARLRGANRRYIEEEIPHIASLICESVEALAAHAEVLVVGNASEEAARALAAVGPHHVVVDLTRGAVRRLPRSGSESVLPSQADRVDAGVSTNGRGISLFFPVYNDAGTVRVVAEKAMSLLTSLTDTWEIIIVDDGSPDNAGEIADDLARKDPRIRVIHHPRNLGYGAAVRSGLAACRFEYICFTDGDDQYEVGDFRKLLRLSDHYDLVITFRYRKIYSSKRLFISWIYNKLLRFLFRTTFRDISTGLRIVRKCVIDDIDLETNSPFIGAELAIKTMLKGYRVGEVGIQTFPRTFGSSSAASLKNVIATLRDVWEIYWKVFSDEYDLPKNRHRVNGRETSGPTNRSVTNGGRPR